VDFRSILTTIALSGYFLCAQVPDPASRTTVVCSFEMEPLLLAWIDGARGVDPEFKLQVRPNSAEEVVKALVEGKSLLAPINRELKPEEISAFAARWGYAPTRLAVAADALVILVPKANPIKALGIDQLDAIWTTTRRSGYPKDISTWGDLGLRSGKWARRPVVGMDRPEGDGLQDYFREYVTKRGRNKEAIRPSSDAMALVEELGSNEAAIGYGGLGDVLNNLRAVPLIPPGGKTAVNPSLEAVASGEYPLTRIVYVYFNRAPNQPINPALLEFLQFVISSEGQQLMAPLGFAPLPHDILIMNKRRLDH
jgi:phosphate transport system substrate-binding protein